MRFAAYLLDIYIPILQLNLTRCFCSLYFVYFLDFLERKQYEGYRVASLSSNQVHQTNKLAVEISCGKCLTVSTLKNAIIRYLGSAYIPRWVEYL